MRIFCSSGHGLYIRGASGNPAGSHSGSTKPPQLDEVDCAREIVEAVADLWRASGVEVETFHDDTSHDQGTNLETITDAHNNWGPHDLDVSVHLNAFDGIAHGVEVLHLTKPELAAKVSAAIAEAGGFTNRGAKVRDDLYVINNTNEPCILLEVCFCDNTSDSNSYNERFDAITRAIAESISGVPVDPAEPIPPLPEHPPPLRPDRPDRPQRPTGENVVEINAEARGDVVVTLNGVVVFGETRCANKLALAAKAEGDLTVVINGEEFHSWKPPPQHLPPLSEYAPNHTGIFATMFGGAADAEHSAYPPYDSDGQGEYLDDQELYVSLPTTVDDAEVRERGVEVFYRATNRKFVAPIRDKGPWTVNDDAYVFGDARPVAETCHNEGTPLPSGSGNNAGKVPANPAGIDLSPALFNALGLTDNDIVDWRWVQTETA